MTSTLAITPTNCLTHPAVIQHMRGNSLTYAIGKNFTTYIVQLFRGEYLVTEWNNGEFGVQRV